MRLTLRTMLAYLDDILEPADAHTIGEKIDESEYATNLMHRIRDVTRRLRLAAPKVDGKGLALDPNTVAEYLDNTLPGERVPDFEKICLESDVHLAEVASAHQILALVLGEPAEIKPALRDRMYALTQAPAPAAASAAAPATAPVASGSPSAATSEAAPLEPSRRKPEVPEYLRSSANEGRSSRWVIAVGLSLLMCGAAAFAFQTGWLKLPNQEVAQVTDPTAPSLENGTTPTDSTPTDPTSTALDTPEDSTATSPTPQPPALEQPATSGSANGSSSVATPTAPGSIDPAAPPPGAEQPAALTGPSGSNDPSQIVISNSPAGIAPLPPMPEAGTGIIGSGTVSSGGTTGGMPEPSGSVASPTPGAPSPGASSEGSPAAVPPLQSPEGIGRYVSEREVLLSFDPQASTWGRLSGGAIVYPGNRLLALPTYRANLALTAGINMQLRGATAIDLVPPDAQGVPGVRLNFGRLVLLSVGRPGAQIRLWLGDQQGTLTFGNGDATVALEVRQELPRGANPEQEHATQTVHLYATSGEAHWLGDAATEVDVLKAPAQRVLSSGADTNIPATELPAWINTDDRSPIDRRASLDVEELLPAGRPITLSLKELATDRRAEISALAVRCLALIGEYDSIVAMLNSDSQRAAWSKQAAALRDALSRGPETAANIRETFVRLRGTKGEELYRMLWGYNTPQLETGSAAQLVERLDHEDLDFRVLAIINLHEITGTTLYYQPEFVGARRQQYVVRWRQRLEAGQVIPKSAPMP